MIVSTIWLRLLLQSPQLSGSMREIGLVIAAAGVALICAVVWTAAHAVGPLLMLLDWLLIPWARLRAVVRPAAGYLTQQRGRATVTMALFGMVIFIMVAALTLIDVLVNAYGNVEPPVAGFDLRMDLDESSAISDLEIALADAPAVSRASFGGVGGIAFMETTAIQFETSRARWQDAPLAIVDEQFLTAIQTRMQHQSSDYTTTATVWTAMREQPGTVVITGRLPDGFVLPNTVSEAFEPFTIWLRPPSDGLPVKVSVIGIIDASSDLEPGIYTSRTTAASMSVALPSPRTYFLSLAQGVQARDAAQGLQISFGAQGGRITILNETARLIQTIRLLLIQIVQGFLGLGLLAGIAAVGLLGVQAVLERRQQLATLRSIGFTTWQMCATIVVESGMVAVVGIATGVIAGLVLSRSLIAVFALRYPELLYSVPWQQILVTTGIAWFGSTAIILLAAWQAGRVAPAEALRVT
jgi:putative ABC transport system permease protein